jgi:DNA processing protein
MVIHPHLRYWLAALFIPEAGPRTVLKWLAHFADIEKLFTASILELQAAGVASRYHDAIFHPCWSLIDRELALAAEQQVTILCLTDERYPKLLKEISDPPLVLYVRGNQSALWQQQLAMVGSRNATPAGIANAENFALALAKAGLAITSGLALGVDAACHRGALTAGGITIAVMGTGLNHIYPASNRKLAEAIITEAGAIISEFPFDTGPKAQNFPRRNRIIGGLSQGVLVVEAALKSGSLITARHALEQGRDVFAIPGSIHNPVARGCHYLIQQGAKLVTSAQDILEELQMLPTVAAEPKKSPNGEPPQNHPHSLLKQIDYEMTATDTIILRSGLTAGEVSSILLALELQGHIQAVIGGYVRTVKTGKGQVITHV